MSNLNPKARVNIEKLPADLRQWIRLPVDEPFTACDALAVWLTVNARCEFDEDYLAYRTLQVLDAIRAAVEGEATP